MADHLAVWCETRAQVRWENVRHGVDWPTAPVRPARDGIANRIATIEHARDPERARRLLRAYGLVREDAEAGKTLNLELLATWQSSVLATAEVMFRTGPAFAKNGRERYGLQADTPSRFGHCLAGSQDRSLPLAARAARLYLDVCFFHPFADGNARSALLALAFVLAKDGVMLDEVGPVAQVKRRADDPEGAAGLADLVVALIEGTQRRLRQDHPTARESMQLQGTQRCRMP